MDLAEVARREAMPGKALHYYRAVLERDPSNLEALAGEGQALAQKGALDKAKRNLARLQSICGDGCAPRAHWPRSSPRRRLRSGQCAPAQRRSSARTPGS
jgi:hypothetical protein